MLTSCTHCGTNFNVPDKALGKQAQCKSCGEMFMLTPVPGSEPDKAGDGKSSKRRASDRKDSPIAKQSPTPPPKRQPSPKRAATPAPAPAPQAAGSDPLDALADAAFESGAGHAPVHGHRASRSRHHDEDDDRRGPHRVARGAALAMGTGATSLACSVIGLACGIVAVVKKDDQSLLIALGLVGVGLLVLSAVLAMMAVVNGSSAMRQIRHARHPLGGRGQASNGTLLGWIGMGLVVVSFVGGAIWLSQNRDAVTFQQQYKADGTPVSPGQ